MIKEPQSIPKNLNLPPSMDFSALKQEGIDLAQHLSGDIWTDYNEHDPGVTILEQLCYAMTELGYKASFDIEKILFAKSGDPIDYSQYVLYEAFEIFPCNPFNVTDYRRLIIDHSYPLVKNAWVIPKDQSVLGLNTKGLYKVLLQTNAEEKEVIEKITTLLLQHRNLCEDFDEFHVLNTEDIAITADVSISTDSISEAVLANILFDLAEFFSPQVRFDDLEDLLEKGLTLDEIYDGPPVVHGFVNKEDLERTQLDKLSMLFKSELIKVISSVEGVLEVSNFSVTKNGRAINTEQFFIKENHLPQLNKANSAFRLFIGEILYEPDQETTDYILKTLENKNTQIRAVMQGMEEVPKLQSNLKVKDLEYYYSLQNTFPRLYGIGPLGLPYRSTPDKKAYAQQLKGYLMHFDQLLANYLAQLVRIRQLFSIEEKLDQTYFHQTPDTIVRLESLFEKGKQHFEEQLEQLMRKFDPYIQRRSRFLNHLLARLGEEFMADTFNALNRQAGRYEKEEYEISSIRSKINFLKNYIDISRNKSKGYDYGSSHQNMAGIKKKLCLLFNIRDYKHRLLTEVFRTKKISYTRKKATQKTSTSQAPKNSFSFNAKDPRLLSTVLRHGLDRNNFSIKEVKKGQFTVFFNNPKLQQELAIYQGTSAKEAEEAIGQLIQYLRHFNQKSEGFHLLEHVLLRPIESTRYLPYLTHNNTKLLLSFTSYPDKAKGNGKFAEQLLQFGTTQKNYEIRGEHNLYTVYLKNTEGEIIAHIDGLKLKKTANQLIKNTIQLLQESNQKNLLKQHIQTEEVIKPGSQIENDPYSLQMTFVLPDWTARFQNKKVQQLFEQVAKVNIPAHLSANFYWINIKDMISFEDIYQKWLNEKAKNKPNLAMLDSLSYELLQFLKER